MQEMDRRIDLLRLLLADLNARIKQAQEAHDGLRGQLSRIVDFAVRSNISVTSALAALAEAEERAAQQEMILRHLTMLQKRAQSELEALRLTRGVSDAHARLHELEARRRVLLAAPPTGAAGGDSVSAASLEAAANELVDIEAEIASLHAEIDAASAAAARALSEGSRDRPGQGPRERA